MAAGVGAVPPRASALEPRAIGMAGCGALGQQAWGLAAGRHEPFAQASWSGGLRAGDPYRAIAVLIEL